MVEINGQPILWHIMKEYSEYGFQEFIICAGYKQHYIKEWFANYYLHQSDVTFDFTSAGEMQVHKNVAEPWKVTIVDTGLNTMTGGRVKRIQKYVGDEPFLLTYGDGVSDVNISDLIKFHKESGAIATLTAVQPGGKFGALDIDSNGAIKNFAEKRKEDGGWINGGYMVCQPEIFNYLHGDEQILEREPLEKIALEGKLAAYKHSGFWHCMDTLRDKEELEGLVLKGEAPWIKWK
jgi:glucose-1-phosphate cytidylyltransferase